MGAEPVLIMGPCGLESIETALGTARFIRSLAEKHKARFIFKGSFLKDNRTSSKGWSGPGLERGLGILEKVRAETGLPILTVIHVPSQAAPVAEVADIIQIPAFLCRQTSLLEAAGATGRPVNVKKGQFMAPGNMSGAVAKLKGRGCPVVWLTERGTFFGYGDLVVDMRSLSVMAGLCDGVILDVTHSLQRPGALGGESGGDRSFALSMARAAAAWGVDGLFLEVHPDPASAMSDASVQLDFAGAGRLVTEALRHWRGTETGDGC